MLRPGSVPNVIIFSFCFTGQEMQTHWKDDEENTKDKPKENKGMRKTYYIHHDTRVRQRNEPTELLEDSCMASIVGHMN